MQFKNYLFDCDGVIFNSNELKIAAMKEVLEGFPLEVVLDFIESFRAGFGKSRYYHIKNFAENFSKDSLSEERIQSLIKKFGLICTKMYQECELCVGAEGIFEAEGIERWVVSGGDQAELIRVFEQRGLSEFFRGIYGSPKSKSDNILSVLVENSLSREESCYIGDSKQDFLSARENGVQFIFCQKYSNTPELGRIFADEGALVINNLTELY